MYNIHITARCGVFLWIGFEPTRTRAGGGGWGGREPNLYNNLEAEMFLF